MKEFIPKFTITNTMTEALTRIERARGFLEAATLSEDWIARMSQRALLLEAHHTTHIEGTQLTLEQAEKLWDGGDVENANPDDKQELLNYRNAFNLVVEYLTDGSLITEGLIREIHNRLVEGVRGGQGQPGRYRTVQNYVVNGQTGQVVYTPPAPGDVPAMMQQLVNWLSADSDIHPVLISGIAQFQLVHIHPFVDGNGRTSRLLSTLCLYRSGYDFKRLFTISEYYDRKRVDFYNALQQVRKDNMDLTVWLDYFLTGLATQLDEVKTHGTQAIQTDVLIQKHNLNDRQAQALDFLLDHHQMHIRDMEEICPNVNRRTLQRDLQQMENVGIILKKGAARQSLYSLKHRNL